MGVLRNIVLYFKSKWQRDLSQTDNYANYTKCRWLVFAYSVTMNGGYRELWIIMVEWIHSNEC